MEDGDNIPVQIQKTSWWELINRMLVLLLIVEGIYEMHKGKEMLSIYHILLAIVLILFGIMCHQVGDCIKTDKV